MISPKVWIINLLGEISCAQNRNRNYLIFNKKYFIRAAYVPTLLALSSFPINKGLIKGAIFG